MAFSKGQAAVLAILKGSLRLNAKNADEGDFRSLFLTRIRSAEFSRDGSSAALGGYLAVQGPPSSPRAGRNDDGPAAIVGACLADS